MSAIGRVQAQRENCTRGLPTSPTPTRQKPCDQDQVLVAPSCGSGVFWASVKMTIIGSACCRKDDGRLLRPASELGFDYAGCLWAAGTGVFEAASRASRNPRNRAVFSRVAAPAAWYSAIACCPSRSCCSFFLKAASARSRARLTSVSNVVTPFRPNPLAGQTFYLRSGCGLPMQDMPPNQFFPKIRFQPGESSILCLMVVAAFLQLGLV